MTASTLDTLSAMDKLRDAGFDERQARAIIGTLRGAAQGSATPDRQATSEHGRAVWFRGSMDGRLCRFSSSDSRLQQASAACERESNLEAETRHGRIDV